MSRPEALRRARELRKEFRATGEPFTQTSYREELANRLQDLNETAYEGFIDSIATKVDNEALRECENESHSFLPGMEFDLDGEYKLGDGRRIAKADARRGHMEAALHEDDLNLERVTNANKRKHTELEELEPYFGPGVRKSEAVQAYRAANQPPQAEAGA